MTAFWRKFVKWQPFEGKFGPLQFAIVVISVLIFRLVFGV
jgi:hypothetical protein